MKKIEIHYLEWGNIMQNSQLKWPSFLMPIFDENGNAIIYYDYNKRDWKRIKKYFMELSKAMKIFLREK